MTAVAESISNGNMNGWGSTTYTWDEFNRLVAINGTSLDASYKYDALGRRIEKTINGTTTRYLYDGADIILEMDENNVATAYYIRTLNMDEPLARIELDSGGNVTGIRFYLADALGSTIALTDENGDIKTRYNYTPFGEPEVIGEQSDNPFMFTGREYDEGTGLYYYRARYYSWELGRFISEDPIGLAGGINMYAYVGNSPLNWIDLWGLISTEEIANILFNETRSLSGPKINIARYYIAHAIFNADKKWGEERFKYASTAPSTVKAIPEAEAGAYKACMLEAIRAKWHRKVDYDPTEGATNFNFRNTNGTYPWRKTLKVKTHLGPFKNSFPTAELNATGIYANTYGER